MRIFKKILIILILISFSSNISANTRPDSFADLAEKLMPSVVNISTSTTVVTKSNPLPFQFPPGSPFGDMFRKETINASTCCLESPNMDACFLCVS